MARNVEIKARVRNWETLKAKAEAASDGPAEWLQQEDTFFKAPAGRLKLRALTPDRGELIAYQRENVSGPKQSDYHIAPTTEPDALKSTLAAALGVRGVVRKQRWLYRCGQTRIHLDQVEGLGAFMELEVVLAPGQTLAGGQAVAAGLMELLGIAPGDLIDVAYIDLIEQQSPDAKNPPPLPLLIRPFAAGDQPAARRLILAGLEEHWGALDLTLNPDLNDIARSYASGTFLVACLADALVGTGALIPEADGIARIVRMSVDTRRRRAGIGARILGELIQRARDAGCRRIVLETTQTWVDAISFYLRSGFAITGLENGDIHFTMDLA